MNLKKNLLVVFLFLFFVFNYSFVGAGFTEYTDSIKKASAEESRKQTCSNSCPTDQKYYQLTTGLPFLDANATRCSCVPVSMGMNVFLPGVLKFILGSVGTITVIIIIVAGFMWSFSAGNKKIKEKATKMISDAVIGLVLTLTSGLMLQVVNPKLLSNDALKIEKIEIESSGAKEGEYCTMDGKIYCQNGYDCVSLKQCNKSLQDYNYYLNITYGKNDGMCVANGKTLACFDSYCSSNSVCMNIIHDKQIKNSGYCSGGSESVCKMRNTLRLGGVCGTIHNNYGVCDLEYHCLREGGVGFSRCYKKECLDVLKKGDKNYDCKHLAPTACCEYMSVCKVDPDDNRYYFCQ